MDEPQPTDIELAESPAGELNLLQAASVFYRWRQAALKVLMVKPSPRSQGASAVMPIPTPTSRIALAVQANFRKELTELLDAVSEEEEGKRALQAQHTQTRRQ